MHEIAIDIVNIIINTHFPSWIIKDSITSILAMQFVKRMSTHSMCCTCVQVFTHGHVYFYYYYYYYSHFSAQ